MNLRRKCPHCDKPAPSGSNGHHQRQCAHCRKWLLPTPNNSTPKKLYRKHAPPICRELQSALNALEYAPNNSQRYMALSAPQKRALEAFLMEVIAYVRSRDRQGLRRPKTYQFNGGRVQLRYSSGGALCIYSNKTKAPLAATYPGRLW